MNPIIDLHTDFILGEKNLGKKLFGFDMQNQINLDLVKKANIKLLFAGFSYDNTGNKTKKMLEASLDFLKKHNNDPKIILHLEGAEIVANDPELFHEYTKLGVRSVGLTHSKDNSLAGSSSSGKNAGLTKKGINIIKLALKNDLLIDLAHLSKKSFKDTLKLLNKPPVLSHTACYKLEKNPRNTTNKQIKEISKLGGILGIFFSGKYIASKKPTIRDVVNHFEHVAELVGIEHLAIGSDFGGITTGTPVGLESANKLPSLLVELEKRGFSKDEIKAIAYDNAKRVLSNWWPEFLL